MANKVQSEVVRVEFEGKDCLRFRQLAAQTAFDNNIKDREAKIAVLKNGFDLLSKVIPEMYSIDEFVPADVEKIFHDFKQKIFAEGERAAELRFQQLREAEMQADGLSTSLSNHTL